ncbi:MAG: response regulator [Clostridia bacterium]|nr:response regulator [Clostridia bacterium]
MDNYTVLILAKIKTLSLRIKKTLEDNGIQVIDVDNEEKLFTSLDKDVDISIVILDVEVAEENAARLIKQTRKSVKDIPIIILSSGSDKQFYMKAMLQGATDFVIKPFNNDILIQKVFKYLNEDSNNGVEFITMDLNRYIKGELKKAEKGNFPISLMFLYFDNNEKYDINSVKNNSFIFKNMQDLFWDTDVFIRFASKYYLGVFPFCDEVNTKVVSNKLNTRFQELKEANSFLADYNLVQKFVSYPFDTIESDQVYKMLIDKINQSFSHVKILKGENN